VLDTRFSITSGGAPRVPSDESRDHKNGWSIAKTGRKDFYIIDTELLGFGVRVRAPGAMSFIAQYKAGKGRGAPTRRVTLGPVGRLTLADIPQIGVFLKIN
jgi:hypothetical protein